ncbi:hypothetical protein LRS74_01900 [Streptomyces sp. LX-29]|uniref:hypothetical protein n=1 Tax=Streptomyces sp. LX-29 TaxID=2900152 RepID=UPI00240E73E5|nr:hypothetical protein [Streptomyces sp. LX-29]WFB05920.1 hypothetical protein LRS74_01900 [Streptomyces sp. LX-29]
MKPSAAGFHYRATSTHRVDTRGQEPHERKYHAGHRWWTLRELVDSDDTIHPSGLAGLVAELVAGRVPAQPVRLPWHH